MGGLTAFTNLPIGSGIGQIPEPNPSARNLLQNTHLGTNSAWTLTGAATMTAVPTAQQWNAGFVAQRMLSANGTQDRVNNPTVAIGAAVQAAVQFEVSVDSDFTQLTNPSASCRLAVNWTGGVAREDSVDINPASGLILSASAGVTGVQVTQFTAQSQDGHALVLYRVSFITPATPAATTAGELRIYPRSDTAAGGATGDIVCGAWQIEQNTFATAFISTPVGAGANRPLGTIPRQSVDLTCRPHLLNGNYTYEAVVDNAVSYLTASTITLSLPLLPAGSDGEWFWLANIGSGVVTLQATGGAKIEIPGATFNPAINNAVTIPFDGVTPSGGAGPFNAAGVVLSFSSALSAWVAIATTESHGAVRFTASGNFPTPIGCTQIWVDGTAAGSGAGGCAAANSASGGGGTGGAVASVALATVPGTTYAVTLGAIGTGGAAGNNNGNDSSATTVGALLTLSGATHGNGAAANTIGQPGFTSTATPTGGSGSSGYIAGSVAVATAFNTPGQGGQNMWGGGTAFLVSKTGATQSAGNVGISFGGGGEGAVCGPTSATNVAGGDGAPGFILIRW